MIRVEKARASFDIFRKLDILRQIKLDARLVDKGEVA